LQPRGSELRGHRRVSGNPAVEGGKTRRQKAWQSHQAGCNQTSDMNICIKVIPHDQHRYETCGDWYYDKAGVLQIRVSKMGDWRYEMLVAAHELVEVLICKHRKITVKQVDKFDMDYEKRRPVGNFDEPGDDPRAPYHNEHCIATGIERILAACLGVSWKKYEATLESL
jgi:hypothetical protein